MGKRCATLLLLGLGIAAQATTVETVHVGDAGNPADANRHGTVAYDYNIGKYEVTTAQYCEFLNAVATISDIDGLWNPSMAYHPLNLGCGISRSGDLGAYTYSVLDEAVNKPVNYVSFWDACRFANWLCTGDTETGAYTMRAGTVTRNAGWTWAVASEDEWYKAAYYNGDGTYWKYPTKSNDIPSHDQANYYRGIGIPVLTDVGAFPYASHYGTFDQGGNVMEWTDTGVNWGASHSARGGSHSSDYSLLESYTTNYYLPQSQDNFLGFRIVQAVPEPSSVLVLIGGLALLRRRRA